MTKKDLKEFKRIIKVLKKRFLDEFEVWDPVDTTLLPVLEQALIGFTEYLQNYCNERQIVSSSSEESPETSAS